MKISHRSIPTGYHDHGIPDIAGHGLFSQGKGTADHGLIIAAEGIRKVARLNQQRLLLTALDSNGDGNNRLDRSRKLGLDVGTGGGREVGLTEGGQVVGMTVGMTVGVILTGERSRSSLANEGLGLGSILANVLLGQLGSLLGVLLSDGLQLSSLGANDVASTVKLGIDNLLVGLVDERAEEGESGADQGKTPVGNDLDEVIGEESGEGNEAGNVDVLSEEDALSLDDEEVDELVNIANSAVKSLLGNSIILARAQLSGEALVENGPAGNFGGNGGTKDHPGELETQAEHIKVPNKEDASNDAQVSNGGGT